VLYVLAGVFYVIQVIGIVRSEDPMPAASASGTAP
jgi:hypothetical protein